jgi:hypothetical protein
LGVFLGVFPGVARESFKGVAMVGERLVCRRRQGEKSEFFKQRDQRSCASRRQIVRSFLDRHYTPVLLRINLQLCRKTNYEVPLYYCLDISNRRPYSGCTVCIVVDGGEERC